MGGWAHGYRPTQPEHFTNSPLNGIKHRHDTTTFYMWFLSHSFEELLSQQIAKPIRECLQKICNYHFTCFISSRILGGGGGRETLYNYSEDIT